MTIAEQLRHKLGVCRKESPGYPIVEAMRGKKICKFTPNISYVVEKQMERNTTLLIEEYTENYKHDPQYRKLYHNPKNTSGEYGYYVSSNMSHILNFMQILGIKRICDIGCGFGVAMKVLEGQDMSIDVRGYDNEPYLIELSADKRFQVKDALTLVKADIRENEILYMWEPFRDKKMSAKFVANLANICTSGQILAMSEFPYENTVTNLLNNSQFDYVCNFGRKYIFVKN